MSPLRGSRTLRTFFYRDVTPTGFKDLADVFLQRCHPYGVQGPCGRFSTEMPPLRGSRTLRTFFYRDATPTGFKDLADVFLQRCHPYGVQGPCGRFSTEMPPLRGSRTLRTFFYRDVTPTGFKDLADVFLQRCHPYGVQETFAERICRDLQQIPRNVPKLTPMVRFQTAPTRKYPLISGFHHK